jgi:hypothetical protein
MAAGGLVTGTIEPMAAGGHFRPPSAFDAESGQLLPQFLATVFSTTLTKSPDTRGLPLNASLGPRNSEIFLINTLRLEPFSLTKSVIFE